MVELRCLYLAKNLINRIQGLDSLINLTILDLSYNRLTHLENLQQLPNLQTLNIAHNSLSTADAVRHLELCSALTNIDITNNRLETSEDIMQVFQNVPKLVALSINGNEVTKLPSFRKRMIAGKQNLGYLDRPIDELERIGANAFAAGGPEAETAARQEYREQQNQKRVNEMTQFRAWQAEQQKLRDQARAEGRSLITEFTPEEQEQRRQEAEAAAAAEKRILEGGIGKLAAKYWQLEGRGDKSSDPLEAAAKALIEDEERQKKAEELRKLAEKEEEESGSQSQEIDGVSERVTSIKIEEIEFEEKSTPVEESKAVEESEEEIAAREAAKEQERIEEEERLIREQRVQDSLAIYKKQLQDKKNGIVKDDESAKSSTWQNATASEVQIPRPLYWSEAMDFELARQVKACIFDFDLISEKMIEAAKAKKLDSLPVARNPELLTNEACRIRWAQLDANQWCVPAPGVTAQDTVFRMNISDDILQRTGGVQPSFEQLATLASGSRPSYLRTPLVLPSVQGEIIDAEQGELDLD